LFAVLGNQSLIIIIRTIHALMIVAVINFNPDATPLRGYQLRQLRPLIMLTSPADPRSDDNQLLFTLTGQRAKCGNMFTVAIITL
jgi:hypothetical protein